MKKDVPKGMTKDVWFEYKVHEAIVIEEGVLTYSSWGDRKALVVTVPQTAFCETIHRDSQGTILCGGR